MNPCAKRMVRHKVAFFPHNFCGKSFKGKSYFKKFCIRFYGWCCGCTGFRAILESNTEAKGRIGLLSPRVGRNCRLEYELCHIERWTFLGTFVATRKYFNWFWIFLRNLKLFHFKCFIFQFKSHKSVEYFEVLNFLYEDYHPCEHYNADKYLTSAGLIVSSKYRGRCVGEHLLRARDAFCQQFDIKLTTTIFTSAYSNRIADKTGFKLDKSIR